MSDVEYLKSIISPLLLHPTELKIAESQDRLGVLLTVTCHDLDAGVVIGRGGVNASAIRQLMRSFGINNKSRISVLIKDPKYKGALPVNT